MIPKGLFGQIAVAILSIAIIITYVQPAFLEIGTVQDSISAYRLERDKVKLVNDQLASLVSQVESVSRDDQRRLLRYMPDSVDKIAVQRDLLLITLESGVVYTNVSYDNLEVSEVPVLEDGVNAPILPEAHIFNLAGEGTYAQIKELFNLLGQSDYPLEVHRVEIDQMEGGFLSVNVDLITYAFSKDSGEVSQIVF